MSYPLGKSAREERLARARENARNASNPDTRAMYEREVENLETRVQISRLWQATRKGDSFAYGEALKHIEETYSEKIPQADALSFFQLYAFTHDLGFSAPPTQWGVDAIQQISQYSEDDRAKTFAFPWVELGHALFKLHQGDDSWALAILNSIEPDSMVVSDRFVSGYLNYQIGLDRGDSARLGKALDDFAVLEADEILADCNPTLLAMSHFYSADIHLQNASAIKDDKDAGLTLHASIVAIAKARRYLDILYAPAYWSLAHEKTSEIFDVSSKRTADARRVEEFESLRDEAWMASR